MLIRRSERIRKPELAAPFQCPDRPEKFDTPSSESTGARQQLPPMSEVVWIVLDSELENTGYSEVIRSAAQWTAMWGYLPLAPAGTATAGFRQAR
jgi:dienelactone hydrolase